MEQVPPTSTSFVPGHREGRTGEIFFCGISNIYSDSICESMIFDIKLAISIPE